MPTTYDLNTVIRGGEWTVKIPSKTDIQIDNAWGAQTVNKMLSTAAVESAVREPVGGPLVAVGRLVPIEIDYKKNTITCRYE